MQFHLSVAAPPDQNHKLVSTFPTAHFLYHIPIPISMSNPVVAEYPDRSSHSIFDARVYSYQSEQWQSDCPLYNLLSPWKQILHKVHKQEYRGAFAVNRSTHLPYLQLYSDFHLFVHTSH